MLKVCVKKFDKVIWKCGLKLQNTKQTVLKKLVLKEKEVG